MLVPIILILLGSFVPLAVGEVAAITPIVIFLGDKNFPMMAGVIYATLISRKYLRQSITDIMTEAAPLAVGEVAAITPIVIFLGDKNFPMMAGVIYATLISRKYLRQSITDIMTEAADQVGLILLITGAGGAFGKIL